MVIAPPTRLSNIRKFDPCVDMIDSFWRVVFRWIYITIEDWDSTVNKGGSTMKHGGFTMTYTYLAGGFNLPLWKIYEFVSWSDDIPFPTEWKVIKFHGSKPPTSYTISYIHLAGGWVSHPPGRICWRFSSILGFFRVVAFFSIFSLFGKIFPNYWNQPGWHAILFVSFM